MWPMTSDLVTVPSTSEMTSFADSLQRKMVAVMSTLPRKVVPVEKRIVLAPGFRLSRSRSWWLAKTERVYVGPSALARPEARPAASSSVNAAAFGSNASSLSLYSSDSRLASAPGGAAGAFADATSPSAAAVEPMVALIDRAGSARVVSSRSALATRSGDGAFGSACSCRCNAIVAFVSGGPSVSSSSGAAAPIGSPSARSLRDT
mmetsp:Transcript_4233/g.13543  ORF Transcript_4233/g.13543 Transcript_4233/m.13543 type:complete len:205 (-) Transcript_4233:1524-2138(-)